MTKRLQTLRRLLRSSTRKRNRRETEPNPSPSYPLAPRYDRLMSTTERVTVKSDSQIFDEWLRGTTTVTTRTRKGRKPAEVKHGLLVEQYDGSPSITDGKRRGFNGIKPRERAPELTSDCIVTTAGGDHYTIKRSRNRRTELTPAEMLALVDLQNKIVHRTTASDLPAIGNVE